MAATVAVAATAACDGDSDGEQPAAAGGALATCDTPGRTVTVTIDEFVFDPTPVEVERCDEVVWTNGHDQAHTSTGDAGQKWSTGNIAPGETSAEAVQFEKAGSFTYICALHPFMKGTVTVAA